MPNRILIVDDDEEFCTLLTDVFEQADYVVTSCGTVDEAQSILAERELDLVVTDYRMPGRSGLYLIDQLREAAPHTPVIMVSGFLENSVIRDLIGKGVGGIFMKPLNIFSLLKKAGELISRAEKTQEGSVREESAGFAGNLAFRFRSFPCKDERARDFARRVHELRHFSKNLLVISNAGFPLRTLCEDLVAMGEAKDHLVFLPPSRVTREGLFDELERVIEQGAEQVTFMVAETASLDEEQCELLYQLSRQKGPFVALNVPKRFIFSLRRDLNYYYDSGLIDEEFYIFLGSMEISVPELDEIPDDLPLLADSLLQEVAPGKRFESAARATLARQNWPGHIDELRKSIETAAHRASGSVVSTDDVQVVLSRESGAAPAAVSPLADYLQKRRADYDQALEMMERFIYGAEESSTNSTD
jgi:two-component system response regulator GlrR